MPTLLRHIAIVSESKRVKIGDLMKVAAALQKQATRDLAPIWEISATVDAFERLEDVPLGYWRIRIGDRIVQNEVRVPNASGIHLDRNGQPYSLVNADDDINRWSLTASHEALEMLVDPFGSQLVAGDSPKPDQGRVQFMVEVSDPSEAAANAYTVNGVLVSDFYTPNFFDPIKSPGVRYSFTGSLTEPRQIIKGGYLSWVDPVSNHLWQQTWFDGPEPIFVDQGPATGIGQSLRSIIDRVSMLDTEQAIAPAREAALTAGIAMRVIDQSTVANAQTLRADIEQILGVDPKLAAAAPATRSVPRQPPRRPGD
jgi:hypothetical protein